MGKINPNTLPPELHLKVLECLEAKSLANYSVAAKANYPASYAKMLSIIQYSPERLGSPFSTAIQQGNYGRWDLGKIDEGAKFARDPKNGRFIDILDRTFPERVAEKQRITQEITTLWIKETRALFKGPMGCETGTFFQNVENLILSYLHYPRKSVLKSLKAAQIAIPTNELAQIIASIEKTPAVKTIHSSLLADFRLIAQESLSFQRIVHDMEKIHDKITNIFTTCQARHSHRLQVISLECGIELILEEINRLRRLPKEEFMKFFALSETDHQELHSALNTTIENYTTAEARIDPAGPRAQLTHLQGILKKWIGKESNALQKRTQQATLLWKVFYLEDQERLYDLINSPAFLYIEWDFVLNKLMHFKMYDLFFHLISYPQVLASLSEPQLKALCGSTFRDKDPCLEKLNPSSLLPFFNTSQVRSELQKANSSNSLMVHLLPILLGQGDISQQQWVHLCALHQKSQLNLNSLGSILNALVQERKTDLVKVFLHSHHVRKSVPATSSPNEVISFFTKYPFLWNQLCHYPDPAAKFVETSIRDLEV
jgi:hypothetical protein